MNNHSFKILITSSDQNHSSELASKIKEQFKKIPMEISFASDGSKGIYDFRQKLQHLIITDFEMPVMNGPQLIREVRKIEGSTVIFILGHAGQEMNESGVEFIKLPITNWTEFFIKIEDVIPEEIKAKYGLKRQDTLQLKKLMEFSTNYMSDQEKTSFERTNPLAHIPRYFGISDEEVKSAPVQIKDEPKNLEKTPQKMGRRQIYQYLIEISILLILLIITIIAYWKKFGESEYSDSFLTFKLGMTIITSCAFLGHFSAKAIEKFYLSKIKNN